jgi:hypothetical protein
MQTYGFNTAGQLAQPQAAVAPAQQPLGANPALQQAQNQQLAAALQSLQQSGEQSKTPGAVGSNLLANALMQWKQNGGYQPPVDASGLQSMINPGIGNGVSPGPMISDPTDPSNQGPQPGWLSPFMQMGMMGGGQ